MSQESPLFNALALTIKQVTPTLEKDEKIYAHQIIAVSDAGRRFTLKERRGLPMQKYVGQKLQCIIEILDAQFFFPANKKEIDALPATTLKGIYQWKETGYKFIPELIRMVEGALDDEDHDYDEDEYEEKAPEYFANWGEFGLGLDIYQTKPMIKMGNGVCLLNEYCQEELIDEWEYGQELYFIPKTLLLRGIHTGKLKYNPIKTSSNLKELGKPQDPNVYKIHKGKKHTEAEWKIKEQELWEEYAKKNNIRPNNPDDKKDNHPSTPPSRFLLD